MDIKDYVFLRPESEYNFPDSAQNQAWQEEEDGGLFQVELCPADTVTASTLSRPSPA